MQSQEKLLKLWEYLIRYITPKTKGLSNRLVVWSCYFEVIDNWLVDQNVIVLQFQPGLKLHKLPFLSWSSVLFFSYFTLYSCPHSLALKNIVQFCLHRPNHPLSVACIASKLPPNLLECSVATVKTDFLFQKIELVWEEKLLK